MNFSPPIERTSRRAGELLSEPMTPIEERLAAILPQPDLQPITLHKAMRHAVLGGGKRIRPRLVLAVAQSCAASTSGLERALRAACAVELVHAASLVHDDLPTFDDAATRRGQPTVHVRFGEDIAILTGDALLTLAFETLSDAPRGSAGVALEMVRRLARATGSLDGIIGGQALEDGSPLASEALERYHACKTAALFRFAAEAGALAAEVTNPGAWGDVGLTLGLAYQAADDLIDACGAASDAGKPVRQDLAHGRPNLVLREGKAAARRRLESLLTLVERRARALAIDPRPIEALLGEMSDGMQRQLPDARRPPGEGALKSA